MHVTKIDTDHQAEAMSMAGTLKDLIAAKKQAAYLHGYWDKPLPWPGAKPQRIEARRPVRRPAAYKSPNGVLMYTGATYDTMTVDYEATIEITAEKMVEYQKKFYENYSNKVGLWKINGAPCRMLDDHEEIIALLDNVIGFMTPENWTKGALARDRNGQSVNPDSPAAVRWCGAGYLFRFLGSMYHFSSPLTHYLERAVHDVSGGSVIGLPKFNDHRETVVEDVKEVFIRARAYALAYGG